MSYEFSSEDNEVFSVFSRKIVILGALVIACGFFFMLYGLLSFSDVGGLKGTAIILESILFMGIGVVFIRPSDNFKKIATTENSDIPQLMTGLNEFSTGFKLMSIFLAIITIGDIFIAIVALGGS
ncbi:MAG: hypothetical protein ACXAD7_09040 [Candidatus Kariarchaeaceae archaeon]|jgi:hypothetical protein